MSRLYNVLSAIVSPFGKELWSGTAWSSGTKTISGSSKYSMYLVIVGGNNAVAVRNGNTIQGFAMTKWNQTHYTTVFDATLSGDVWTLTQPIELPHQASTNHGATSNKSITKVIGLVPNWGGS